VFSGAWVEDGLLETLEAESMGCIVFSPLAQGLLGSTAGKTVTVKLPSGEKRLTVLKVEYK